MAISKYFKTLLIFAAVSIISACSDKDIDANNGKEDHKEVKGVLFTVDSPKASAKLGFVADEEDNILGARTRTTIKHTVGNGADAYWESTDKIWVKDKNGNWRQSIATNVAAGGVRAIFTLPGTMSDYADNCPVSLVSSGIKSNVLHDYTNDTGIYTEPVSGAEPQLLTGISGTQNQTSVNQFSDAGKWGDCGIGKAKMSTSGFTFTIEHKASYLCLLPRCESAALGQNIKLTNITIQSDKMIASDFLLFHENGELKNPASGDFSALQYKTIKAAVNDFPLTNTGTNSETNACYFIVYPGTHNLTINYTIKDYSTNVETTLTREVNNVVCNAGEIADITANLMPYLGFYYIWDAKRDYWDGIESEMPTIDSDGVGTTTSANYPKASNPSDPRWSEQTHLEPQTKLFKKLPNLNEMMWYTLYGDPLWAYNQSVVIARKGHLEAITSDGVWFRKKKVMLAYLKTIGYPASLTEEDLAQFFQKTPSDPRQNLTETGLENDFFSGPTEPFEPNPKEDYFFLPTSGECINGSLGSYSYPCHQFCLYWTSTSTESNKAYRMVCSDGHIDIRTESRTHGSYACPFE